MSENIGCDSLKVHVKQCSGTEFFNSLEKLIDFPIPMLLKNILRLNSYDSAITLSKFDEDSISDIEDFMRNDFNMNMLQINETITDYLSVFARDQQHFKVVSGQKLLLTTLVDACKKLYSIQPVTENLNVAINANDPTEVHKNDLFRIIGAHMISVFNDAKRTTLSAWSWPSRHVAAEMGNNFKINGISMRNSSNNINLEYLTPTNHSEFLKCIVQSDIENTRLSLRESLAVSLRLDESVDRTQIHNVYVMAHITKKDSTTSTLFLGFGIPTSGDASAYSECLKDVINELLPWDEFFALVSSIVTDGENLNIGRLNGLCAKLIRERSNTVPPQLPLFSIWCVAHRINLAWKSVCNIGIVANIIKLASKLSTYFHKSGKRTQQLNDIAARNQLSTPSRYPKYFAVRWTEFVFHLFTTVLRNWRASIKYFQSQSFLSDILSLFKTFQKACQSDAISILDVFEKKNRLIERLENCINAPLQGGWEELFLTKVSNNRNCSFLYGTKLIRPLRASRRYRGRLFTFNTRRHIIIKLKGHLNIRLNLDYTLHHALTPLAKINSSTSQYHLKLCHSFVVPDLDENTFYSEYYMSAELLKDRGCNTVMESLQKLNEISPDRLFTMKYALGRVVAAKPHSGDVERLISVYNHFKDTIRSSLSTETLRNYLYVYTNMNTLQEFDPTLAVNFWLAQGSRRPQLNPKSHQQEWFRGFFPEAGSTGNRERHPKIEF